jgi:hypothetical protein
VTTPCTSRAPTRLTEDVAKLCLADAVQVQVPVLLARRCETVPGFATLLAACCRGTAGGDLRLIGSGPDGARCLELAGDAAQFHRYDRG